MVQCREYKLWSNAGNTELNSMPVSIMKVKKMMIKVFVGLNYMIHHPQVELQENKHIDILKW